MFLLKRLFWFLMPLTFWMAEEGAGGSTTDAGTATDDQAGAQAQSGAPQFTTEQQKQIDRLIAERLKSARAKWDADTKTEADKAKAEAEAAQLKEQQKWQELAEKNEGRVKQLEPLTGRVEKLEGAVAKLLDAKIEALGDEARTAVDALPGEPGALEKLEWLTANEKLFKRDADPKTPGGGTPVRGIRKPGQPVQPDSAQRPIVRL
jgi:hypothetical protein